MTIAIDESRVRAKVAARELCEQILLLVAGEHRALVEAHGQAASEAFWANFREAFEGHFPKPVAATGPAPLKPMDEFEAAQFGKRTLQFGIHKGKTIDDAPRDYLEWLAYNDDDFKTDLRRYLLSERLRREPDDRCDNF